EPILTVLNRNLPQVQQMIDSHKQRCLSKLQLPANQRALIHEPKPTEQEKCLMECVFKSIRLMDGNKLNLQRVQQLASQVTDNNAMAVALSSTLAQSCNRLVRSSKPCEAAHQLNQCIAKHMERNRVKLSW
ncbi:Obp19c, partial [Drosophila busckii]